MVIYDSGVFEKRIDICQFINFVATKPEKIFGLYPRTGKMQPGADADVVVWGHDKPQTSSSEPVQTYAGNSMHACMTVGASLMLVHSLGRILEESYSLVSDTKSEGLYIQRKKSLVII